MKNWLHPFRTWRRKKATSKPFPLNWEDILVKNFPMGQFLSDQDKKILRHKIQVFLAEKYFKGVNGLDITDEICVTIAAQAVLLLLKLPEDMNYNKLKSIIVYPASYNAEVVENMGSGLVREYQSRRLGETSIRGAVVLSWQDAKSDAKNIYDGHNVVFHEFAHQLDLEDYVGDGTPVLANSLMYGPWARVLGEVYKDLRDDIHHNHKNVLNGYGAENAAEFFAVATETFFEKPIALKNKYPELYKQLNIFYKQDPVSYFLKEKLN